MMILDAWKIVLPAPVPAAGQWNRHFMLLSTLGLVVAFWSCYMRFAALGYCFTLRNLGLVVTVLRALKLGHSKGALM